MLGLLSGLQLAGDAFPSYKQALWRRFVWKAPPEEEQSRGDALGWDVHTCGCSCWAQCPCSGSGPSGRRGLLISQGTCFCSRVLPRAPSAGQFLFVSQECPLVVEPAKPGVLWFRAFFFSGGVRRRKVFKDRAQVWQFIPLCQGKPGCAGLSVVTCLRVTTSPEFADTASPC